MLHIYSISFSIAAQMLQVTVSPRVIASGSSVQFNVSCRAKNITQNLYNAEYRFFHCGTEVPASAASNSSYTLVNATTTGNFTCTATQQSDMGTAITSKQSSPVQAIVLGECGPPYVYIYRAIQIQLMTELDLLEVVSSYHVQYLWVGCPDQMVAINYWLSVIDLVTSLQWLKVEFKHLG